VLASVEESTHRRASWGDRQGSAAVPRGGHPAALRAPRLTCSDQQCL